MLIPIEFENKFVFLKQIFIVVLMSLAPCISAYGLSPNQILVIANRNVSGSVELAKYYIKKRGIPSENILILSVTDEEKCSRLEYEQKIVKPVRNHLKSNKDIKCIVTLFGVPLKVDSPELTWADKKERLNLRSTKKEIERRLSKNKSDEEKKQIKIELDEAQKKIKAYNYRYDKSASLDSELTLVNHQNYSLSMWISNPYFAGFGTKRMPFEKSDVVMVCRLDAPTVDDVKRIIDDSLYAEKNGLEGKAYFDARWPAPEEKKLTPYAYYDRSIHLAAAIIQKKTLMPVVKNEGEELFESGQCPDVALYCGWYRLGKYVDAFVWQKGSIGYHIASAECKTLKKKESRVWCKMMLEKGVAATVGPVGEPYVQAFPVPELFFSLLSGGEMTLVECYFTSLSFLSWKMVLVGDPLYNPFKKKK